MRLRQVLEELNPIFWNSEIDRQLDEEKKLGRLSKYPHQSLIESAKYRFMMVRNRIRKPRWSPEKQRFNELLKIFQQCLYPFNNDVLKEAFQNQFAKEVLVNHRSVMENFASVTTEDYTDWTELLVCMSHKDFWSDLSRRQAEDDKIQPTLEVISEIIEKLETLKSKQTDFVNKTLKEIGNVNGKITEPSENTDKPKKPQKPILPSQDEILYGKPAREFTEEAKRSLRIDGIKESLNNYEIAKIKPKEYWPEDIQSLIDEIEILMYPYDGTIRNYGESLKWRLLPLENIIQEMKKLRYKIEIEAQQIASNKTSLENPSEGTQPDSDKEINPSTKEQKWRDDTPNYISSSIAIKMSEKKISAPTLSKLLRKSGNTIRWMKNTKTHRAKVYTQDFEQYLKNLRPIDHFSDEAFEQRARQEEIKKNRQCK